MSKFKKCDDLYRNYLKFKRGPRCELCRKSENVLSFPLSIFHILSKGSHPRLRYAEENTLLSCWTKGESRACHNIWHGAGHGAWYDRRRDEIKKRICELRDALDWDDLNTTLLQAEKYQDRITKIKLEGLCYYYKQEYEKLRSHNV